MGFLARESRRGLAQLLGFGLALGLVALQAAGAEDGAGGLRLETRLDLSALYRYRSAELLIEDVPVKNGIDLARNVLELPPAALFELSFGAERGLWLATGVELRRQFDPAYDGLFPSSNLLPLGRPGNPVAMENPLFTRGTIGWRGDGLELRLGREKVDFGEGIQGSLYPSARLPYLDSFQAKGRLGIFQLDYLIASLRAAHSWDGQQVDPNEGVDLVDFPALGDASPPYGYMDDPNPTTVLLALHRLSWNTERLRLGVTEQILYARRNNYFTLTDFFPLISWHQTKIFPNNMALILEAQWRPIPELAISAMLGIDEFNASVVGVSDSGSPAVPAAVLSAAYDGLQGGRGFDAYAESGYTHYLWGNFDASNNTPSDVDPLARAIYYYQMDEGAGLLPLTSPYGPGALWAKAEAGFRWAEPDLRLGFELFALSKIKEANLITTKVLDEADPAGQPDAARIIFLSAGFPLQWRLGELSAFIKPSLNLRDGEFWSEFWIGAKYRIAGGSRRDQGR